MTPAIQALREASVCFELHKFEAESGVGYGHAAATALDVSRDRVYKTLIAKIDGDWLAVALVSVGTELNLKSLATLSGGKKAELADPAEAQRSTGYVVGGISPIGQRRRLATYMDASAMRHPTIFVSAGRRGIEIELSPSDLADLCNASIGDIAR